MSLVESLTLPQKAVLSPESAISPDCGSTPSSSNPVFRGIAFALAFEAMAAMFCYVVWLALGVLRHR